MSEQSLQKRAELLFRKIKEIRKLVQSTTWNFLAIGRQLSIIRDKKLYATYGDHIKSFEEFLSEDVLPFKRTTAYNLMQLYNTLGTDREDVLDVGYERLVKLLPHMTKENKFDLIEKAKGHREHFNNFMKELDKKPTQDVCEHDGKKFYLEGCALCQKTWRIKNPLDK